MIRTTLSFCALFGSLIFFSKLLQESSRPVASDAPPTQSPAADDSEAAAPQADAPAPQKLSAALHNALPLLPQMSPSAAICGTEHFTATRLPERSGALVIQTAFEEAPAEDAGTNDLADPFSDLNLDRLINGAISTPPAKEPSDATGEETADEETADKQTADEEKADEQTTDEVAPVEQRADQFDPPADETEEKPAAPVLTQEMLELRASLRECLAHYYHRPENVAIRSPWGAMHAMIAYGVDTELVAGDRRVNAIGWLCYNGACNGQQLFHARGGRLQARIGVGVQGHAGQFLAMLAQSRVKSDFPIKADGLDFTVADLIRHEQDTCRPNTELTFKLIALVHYLKSDDKWKSNDGQDWDIPRLIKEELKQPIIGAACGGTHRMTGFSYAVRKREQRKEEFSGQWLRAQKFVTAYHDYTFRLQNPDGSFSTDWFAGRADFGPASRRLETTGHITEWMAFSLSDEELQDPRMVKAVTYLTELLLAGRQEKWSIGPLGHGLHALAIYDERVFGGQPGHRSTELARQPRITFEK